MMRESIGPYRVTEEIGRGGMGIVYLGVHDRLDRPVAIKRLAPELTRNPAFRDRFFAEAKTQAQLQHPNIVGIYDLIEEEGDYFIAMEYIRGQGLDLLIDEAVGRGMPEEEALAIFRQILAALDSAHSVGVIHRDVKPSNVLIDEAGRVKLMDFGIALLVGDKRLTQSSQTIGTPVYMSPEQILRPRTVDHRTDIYSAGVMLYEMLCGRPPFDAETEYEIKRQHIEASREEAVGRLVGVSAASAAALARALRREPAERFSSAAEFLHALDGEAQAAPVPSPPGLDEPEPERLEPSPPIGAPIAAGRSRLYLVGTASIVLVVVAGLGAALLGGTGAGAIPPPVAPSAVEVGNEAPVGGSVRGEVAGDVVAAADDPAPTAPAAAPVAAPAATQSATPPAGRSAAADERRRQEIDQRRSEARRALREAQALLAGSSAERAHERARRGLADAASHRRELSDEVAALEALEEEASWAIAREAQRRLLEERSEEMNAELRHAYDQKLEALRSEIGASALDADLADLAALVKDGKYPEARSLADRLLAREVPPEVAERARALRDEADERLQQVWQDTETTPAEQEVINPRRRKRP